MSIRTYQDKYCDAAARYTAEFTCNLKVADRGVTHVDISCFAPTRTKAKNELRKTLQEIVQVMQNAVEELK